MSVPATEDDSLGALKLVAEAGIDLDAFNVNGDTAIHRAAARGADSIVGYLAERGARLDTKDRRGRTPLDVALGVGGGGRGGPPQVRKNTAELLRKLMQARGLTVPAATAGNVASSQRP